MGDTTAAIRCSEQVPFVEGFDYKDPCTGYKSSTRIVGGDATFAGNVEEFCASVQDSPVVVEYSRLIPLWDFFQQIDGVSSDASNQMKSHFMDLIEVGRQCGIDNCQSANSTCQWHPQTRTWTTPCLSSELSANSNNVVLV